MQNLRTTDYLILGAGPAGLQLAYYLARAGREYLVIDAADHVGSFFSLYPRHRTLLSINKVATGRDDAEYNLRHDWNSLLSDDPSMRVTAKTREYFPPADALVEHMAEFAASNSLAIELNRRAQRIQRRDDGGFEITCDDGARYQAKILLVATGTALPNIPDVPGIELAQGYERMSIDPEDFLNKNVLIIGKGNSAFETADNLIPTTAILHMISPHPVTLAWESRFVGHVRAVNNNFLDTYHLKSQNAIIDGQLHKLERTPSGKIRVSFSSIHAVNEVEQIEYDAVLRCTGFRFDATIFDASCQPALSDCGRLPRMTSSFESPTVPGLYFAGTLTQFLDHKRAQSAFIHGFRYNTESLAKILSRRVEGAALPFVRLPRDSADMARAVLERMNRVSSLWQQVGFLADMIVLPSGDRPGDAPRYYHAYPYDYLVEYGPELAGGADFYLCMFRLGTNPPNAHDYDRSIDVFDGASSVNIHPVLELRSGADGSVRSEFHVLEDFLADWSGRAYVDSVAQYFERSRAGERMLSQRPPPSRVIVRDENMRLVDVQEARR